MKRINVRLAVLMAAIMMTMMSFANRWSSENRAMLASAMSSRDRGRAVLNTQDFGEDLSWEYMNNVRSHPIEWRVPTQILYGSKDHLMSIETITDFANKHQATLTVMDGGEHWFHTEEQMAFLDNWIKEKNV